MNPQSKFVLSGEVITTALCTSVWTVRSNTSSLSFSLSPLVASSSLITTVPAGSDSVLNLVVYSNMLPPRSTLIFTLSCGLSSASVHVTTNGPPLGGFVISLPRQGMELSTVFNFTASSYVDPDLPLTYQFGFINHDIHNVLQIRSLSAMSESILLAGSVTSYVHVFDNYGVYMESTTMVTVTKQENQQMLQDSILTTLHASSGDSEATQKALALGSAVLSVVSCTKAPSCDSLNRKGCSTVADTCGACKPGFIGEEGNSNSLCVDLHRQKNNNNNSSAGGGGSGGLKGCSRDSDCALFEQCDLSSRSCWLPSKTCLNACSGQGLCSTVNINTNLNVKDCKVTDVTCQARCNCNGNFTGADCSISRQALLQRQALRSEMLSGLASIATSTSISSTNLGRLSDTLSSLTSNVYEVSPKMVSAIGQVALNVLTTATAAASSKSNGTTVVNYESLSGILSSVNTIMQVSTINAQSSQMLRLFSDLVSSQLVSGENDVNYIYDSFRLKVVSVSMDQGEQLQLKVPQTAMESAFGSPSSSVSVSSSIQDDDQLQQQQQSSTPKQQLVDMSVSMIITTASSYGSLATLMNNNPVQVKLVSASSSGNDGNIQSSTEIVFNLVHNSAQDFTNTSFASHLSFNTTCYGYLDFSIHNYTCHPPSQEVIVHSCNGRRGVLTSYCKILAPTCALLLDGNSSSSTAMDTSSSLCSVIDYSESVTTCKCTIQMIQQNEQQRRLDNVVVDGVINVVSTSMYIANNFKDTFSSAGEINSLAALKRVLIVIVMFSAMWAVGLMMIFGCIWRRKYMMKVNVMDQALVERKRRVAQVSYSVAMVQQNLLNYTSQLFPSIFSNEPMSRRIWSEISRHHRYLTLMTASKGESGDKQRILTCIQLLSLQTMLMFLLALLYDMQGPPDDGSCITNMTMGDCLSRKSAFDRTKSFCFWDNSVDADIHACMYQQPSFTIETVLIISILVSLMVALLTKPIDMIFDLLTAPTADELKIASTIQRSDNSSNSIGVLRSVGRRMSNMARKVSVVALNTVTMATNNLSHTTKKLLVGLTTRKIPHSTETAHQLATASMSVLASNSIQQLQERHMNRMRSYYSSQHGMGDDIHASDYSDSDDDSSSSSSYSDSSDSDSRWNDNDDNHDHEIRVQERTTDRKKVKDSNSSVSMISGNNTIDRLSNEISCQRRLLKASELELFDEQWGIDPTGEFATGDRSIIPCMKHKDGAYEIISQQLQLVEKEVQQKCEKLMIATDAHTGLEILHLFIKDLLGRSTAAARIFETKADEDFKHTEVVTKGAKRFAMLTLTGLNFFFVYFAILTGFQRGITWQQSYLFACIIQFFVEIILNETMECLWIQCVIPMLVSDEVRKVGDSITEIISDLCSTTPKDSRLFLNAPDYLFVSTNLAKKFPQLMESIVVQSYFSHIPGELSKLWNVGSVARIRRYHSLRRITVLTTLLSIFQYLGTAPFLLHRLFIRFVQPFVFGGLALLWTIIASSPVYIALMSLVLVIIVASCVYKYIYGSSSCISNNFSVITPIVDEQSHGMMMMNGGLSSSDAVVDDNDDDHDHNDEAAPIIVYLDLNDFQPMRDVDDKDSAGSESGDISSDCTDVVRELSSSGSVSNSINIDEMSVVIDSTSEAGVRDDNDDSSSSNFSVLD